MATNGRRSQALNGSVYLSEESSYATHFYSFSASVLSVPIHYFRELMADSTDTSRFAYIRVLDKKHGTQAKLFLNQFGKLFEFNDRTLQGSYIMAKYCAPRACQNLMFTASHLGYQIGFKLGASVRLRLNFFFL